MRRFVAVLRKGDNNQTVMKQARKEGAEGVHRPWGDCGGSMMAGGKDVHFTELQQHHRPL